MAGQVTDIPCYCGAIATAVVDSIPYCELHKNEWMQYGLE